MNTFINTLPVTGVEVTVTRISNSTGLMDGRLEKYVEALRVPLRTYCTSTGGATKVSNQDKVE